MPHRPEKQIPEIRGGEIDKALYELTLAHLAKLEAYLPGPIKRAGGMREKLLESYRSDPMYSIWGLDSVEYVAATLGGGTVTSIHRKLGDIYQDSVRMILRLALGLHVDQIGYSATLKVADREETRSLDAFVRFKDVSAAARAPIVRWCSSEVSRLVANPKIEIVALGMEIRSCYATGDSKRTQADEAMARHCPLSGFLPVMPLFCNQSNPGIIGRYKSVWIVKQGTESYDMVKALTGYDYFNFLKRNREQFRQPIISTIRKLTA